MAKTIVYSSEAPDPIGPYSQAVMVGNMLFMSGQIAIEKPSGKVLTGNVVEETKLVMNHIRSVLEAAGMNFSNVVKTTIFLKDMGDFPEVNKIYGSFFTQDPPARETVEVSRLPKDVSVEISCIAVK